MVAANDGWAVGEGGTILHWDGTAWSRVSSPITGTLSGVAMLSSTAGWAVGSVGTPSEFGTLYQAVILRWNGQTWQVAASPAGATDLRSLAVTSASDIWATGPSGILHWDGNAWTKLYSAPSGKALFSIAMPSPTDGWAVGETRTILRWDGQSWTNQGRVHALAGQSWGLTASACYPRPTVG